MPEGPCRSARLSGKLSTLSILRVQGILGQELSSLRRAALEAAGLADALEKARLRSAVLAIVLQGSPLGREMQWCCCWSVAARTPCFTCMLLFYEVCSVRKWVPLPARGTGHVHEVRTGSSDAGGDAGGAVCGGPPVRFRLPAAQRAAGGTPGTPGGQECVGTKPWRVARWSAEPLLMRSIAS